MLSHAQLRSSFLWVCGATGPPKEGGRRLRDSMPLLPHFGGKRLVDANATPGGPLKPPRQALLGSAKDRSRQIKARRERTSDRSARSQGGLLILRPGNVAGRTWRGLGGFTLSACNKAFCNRRYAEAQGYRCPQSSRKAKVGINRSEGAALLGFGPTGRFTIPFAAGADGRARWYSDRSGR